MKISNSKKQLAKIIHENGGWRDVAQFSAQDKDGDVFHYASRPSIGAGAEVWDPKGCIGYGEFEAKTLPNWPRTILSRDEYFHLYPAPDADGWIEWCGGECPVEKGTLVDVIWRNGTERAGVKALHLGGAGHQFWVADGMVNDIIAYRLHKPEKSLEELCGEVKEENKHEHVEAKPTIEQLAADYRNAKDYADRKQKEADDATADAEAKLKALELAGEAMGLLVSPISAKQEPELVITDWRDLRVGDVIECVSVCLEDNGAEMFDEDKRHHGKVCSVIGFGVGGVNHINTDIDGGLYIQDFKFIRRPAKGDANA